MRLVIEKTDSRNTVDVSTQVKALHRSAYWGYYESSRESSFGGCLGNISTKIVDTRQ